MDDPNENVEGLGIMFFILASLCIIFGVGLVQIIKYLFNLF